MEHGVDDGGAAGAAGDEEEFFVFEDDGGRHRGERALARDDGVGGALEEAEHILHADLGGEVIHFVIHQNAGARNGDAAAVAAVEGVGVGDGVAGGVDDGEVGGLGGFWREACELSVECGALSAGKTGGAGRERGEFYGAETGFDFF